jgi:hypothetical protein
LVRRKITADAIQERNLISKFLYRSLEEAESEAKASGRATTTTGPPVDDVDTATPLEQQSATQSDVALPLLPPLPEPPLHSNLPSSSQKDKHEYARNILWNFEDIRMLIGSDMPIFGDQDHPSVSLRLHNAEKPINILTGLDYWLDNL